MSGALPPKAEGRLRRAGGRREANRRRYLDVILLFFAALGGGGLGVGGQLLSTRFLRVTLLGGPVDTLPVGSRCRQTSVVRARAAEKSLGPALNQVAVFRSTKASTM